jgi:hypothetical protein
MCVSFFDLASRSNSISVSLLECIFLYSNVVSLLRVHRGCERAYLVVMFDSELWKGLTEVAALSKRTPIVQPSRGQLRLLQHQPAWAVHAYLRFLGLQYVTGVCCSSVS